MRKFAIGLAVVVVLLLVVDRAAVFVASRVLDGRVEEEVGAPVDLSIGGFPFLPKAVFQRTLSTVDITAEKVVLGTAELTVNSLDAHLTDVHGSSPANAVAESLTATGVVPYSEAERRGDLPAGSMSGTDDGRVRLQESVDVLGRPLPVVVTGRPALAGAAVAIEDVTIEVGAGNAELSEQAKADLEERLQVQLPLDELPAGTRLTDLQARPEGLILKLEGADVPLSEL